MTMRPCSALAAGLLLAACFSSAPPAPPVRFFDPTPPVAAVAASGRALRLEVDANSQVRSEFAVRVGPRELTFDSFHRWAAEPRELVASALEGALFGSGAFARSDDLQHLVTVRVTAFELDVTAEPTARVAVTALQGGKELQVSASAPAGSRAPDALAEAMAKALGQLAADLRARLSH
jgi:ABC-type uncharacterized transport system auxiliary subunit